MKKIFVFLSVCLTALFIVGCTKVTKTEAGTYYNTVDESSYIIVKVGNTADLKNVKINGKVYNSVGCTLEILDHGKRIIVKHTADKIDVTVSYDGTTISYDGYSYKRK